MLEIIQTLLQEHLYRAVLIIIICTGAIIVAMAVDLFSGVRKARENGEATTSTGLKKTCDKARKYLSPLMALICVDIIACIVLPIPIFSMLWAAYVCYCEFKSIREKAWQKAEIRKQERTMSILLENKDDIAKMVAEIIKNEQKNEDNEKADD
jgi:hypothetical protein